MADAQVPSSFFMLLLLFNEPCIALVTPISILYPYDHRSVPKPRKIRLIYMGNASCFGRRRRSKAAMVVVHPLDHSRLGCDEGGGGVRRLKVRMTSGQLQELMAELKKKKQDHSSGKGLSDDSELGRLVFRECLKGSLHARLVSLTSHDSSHQSTMFSGGNISLSTIQERSDDDDDEDHHDH